MKILFLSSQGDGISLAQRMASEGHSVHVFVRGHGGSGADVLGTGFVNRVQTWRPNLMDSDLVVCDSPGFGNYAKVLRGNGRPVFACNRLADMALSPSRQSRILSLLSMKVPGEEIPQDAVPCIVQAWYNGRSWVRPFLVSMNEDHFMNGDVGPIVPSMGCLTWAAKKDYPLFENVLFPLEKFLKKISWRGPVNVRCRVWLKGTSVDSLLLGFQYDSTFALIEGLQEPLGDAIFETAIGLKKSLHITTFDYMLSARISVPPWPHAQPNGEIRGMGIGELSDQALKHLHFQDAYCEGKLFRIAGLTGVVCSATAVGRSIDEVQARVLRTVRGIPLEDKQYRTDIGKASGERLKKLQEYGYLS